MDFQAQLNAIIGDEQPLSAAGLTFLSDIPAEDRATLALLWPGMGVDRRRKVVSTLVQLAEDNIDYDFSAVLTVLLEDSDAEVRRLAVEGLVENESAATVRRLIGVLDNDPDPAVRAAAANTLGPAALRAETGRPRGDWPVRLRESLLRAVRAPGVAEDVRRRALESVAYFCNDSEVAAQIERAYAGSPLLRASALLAMGRNMDARWAPTLLDALKSPDPMLRFEAAHALGELHEPQYVPALLPLLDDSDIEVRLAAIWSLGQLGGRVAQQALQMQAREDDPAVREAVDDALAEIRLAANALGP
jgi:HEAT repeat protein